MEVHVSSETVTSLNPSPDRKDARCVCCTAADETISSTRIGSPSGPPDPLPPLPLSTDSERAGALFRLPNHLLGRLILFVSLLALECLLRASLPHPETFLAPLASFGIAAFAVFLGLGYPTLRTQRIRLPFHSGLFLAHLAALILLCLESAAAATGYEPVTWSPALFFALRIALLSATVLLLALACIPRLQWMDLRHITGNLWLYAILAGALTWFLRAPFQSLWNTREFAVSRGLQAATFALVSGLLKPLIPALQSDAPGFVLSAPNFAIYVAPECSGLEGLGLILVFTCTWLAWFRREFRFPRALLLIPAALIAVWLLNIVRIAALMLIGNSVSPEIALAGFHSQAGWIAFTLVALAFSTASRHLRWIQMAAPQHDRIAASRLTPPGPAAIDHSIAAAAEEGGGESPATPAYLVPFLAILAASFLSKAASGAFEWLYPLRFVAAFGALWYYRRSLREISMNFSWLAPVTGLIVSLFWIIPGLLSMSGFSLMPGFVHAQASQTADPIASGLAQLSPAARWLWITARILAAVVTVPIAEELAFLGYLARRLSRHNFDTLPYSRLTIVPIVISSVLFGLMQGAWWPAGILAGLVFALLARFRNRISEAIVAHAVANLSIAVWVLFRHDFRLW